MTEKDKTQYGFYYIDNDYLDHLKEYDSHIPRHDYEDEGRERKFYCGPVFNDNGIDYFVPVSHQIKKMTLPDGETYGISLKDSQGQPSGCLDFRFCVPCPFPECLTPYTPKGFAVEQWDFCSKHKNGICREAERTYENILSGDYSFLTSSSIHYGQDLDDQIWIYDDILTEKQEKDNQTENTQPDKTNTVDIQNKNFDQRLTEANTLASANITKTNNFENDGFSKK